MTPDAVATLLARFRRQRPIRGGSLLITIFGDSIAPRGGVVSLGSLIALARPFGLMERLVRTSVARLAGDGWLVARREGRLSEYRLTTTGTDRFAEATSRIYGAIPDSWDGQWTLLVLPSSNGTSRDELRLLGFGQLSPGVFAHPNWSIAEARAALNGLDGLLLKSTSEGSAADQRLVATGWDLGDLTRRYTKFVDTFTPITTVPTDEAAFVVRTLLIHEYRKIHLRDPLLPPALLPDDWVGAKAYDLTKSLYSRMFLAAERYLSNTASTTTNALPDADSSAYARFGGLS